MPKYIEKNYPRQEVGKKVIYQIVLKHRGELSKAFLELLQKSIWEFMGDIPIKDIIIKRINTRG